MTYYVRVKYVLWMLFFALIHQASFSQMTKPAIDLPSLKAVIINGDSVLHLPTDIIERDAFFSHALILSHRDNSIVFKFSDTAEFKMQYYLEGFDRQWTRWNLTSYKEYTNVPAGDYIFRTRIIGADGHIANLNAFKIRVLPLWYLSRLALIIYFVIFLLLIRALYIQLRLRFARTQHLLEQIITKRTEDLIIEKEKTETLLANVLPKNTASEIMTKGKATKIKYNFVTVLFSDIQGFTQIAEEMNPEILIDELDKFFFHFDSVVEKYGIEKIKTIGDAYMCAGGIPEKNRTNPVEVILAALEMQSYMKRLKGSTDVAGLKYWDIRIGIHTGTVIAGVVGHKKLSYDIWGDTVNTASRMESSGEAGKINISGTTFEFVREFFECEYRGKMPVKYKGELEMYFVKGIVPELRDENGEPTRKFIIKLQMIKLEDIEDRVSKMFDDEAPPNLYFHNSQLLKNITNHVELLSTAEKLPDEDYINLKLASVFLLTGYITDYEKPLEASLRLVDEILPEYGFNQENLNRTKKIITNSYNDCYDSLSDNILHDAKYDYLGRVDYLKLSEKLMRERTEYGKQSDKKTWIEAQVQLLSDHEFLTGTGRLLRNVTADAQIKALLKTGE